MKKKFTMAKWGKDKLFITVIVLTFGNIIWWTMWTIMNMFKGDLSLATIAIFVSDIVAVIGLLWLVRTYRRSIKIEKAQQERNKEN